MTVIDLINKLQDYKNMIGDVRIISTGKLSSITTNKNGDILLAGK